MEQAIEVFTGLYSIPLEVAPLSLVGADVTLRSFRGLSFYYVTYVALAEPLDCPMITPIGVWRNEPGPPITRDTNGRSTAGA
jgi:hypothetical protein